MRSVKILNPTQRKKLGIPSPTKKHPMRGCVVVCDKKISGIKMERLKNQEKYWAHITRGRFDILDRLYKRKLISIENKRLFNHLGGCFKRKRKTTIEAKYNILKKSAQIRKKEISLCLEEYKLIHKKYKNKCYYCNKNIKSEYGHSLDRVDSNKGYSFKNVVLCCFSCNTRKSNKNEKKLLESYQIYKKMFDTYIEFQQKF